MDFKTYRNEQLKDPDFKREYDALEPEYELIKMMLKARMEGNLSQTELAVLSGVTQADISRIESGKRNPSMRVMQKLANAMGMTFKLVPIEEST